MPRRPIEEVLAAHNESLLTVSGVVGTAIGLRDGMPCIRVLVANSGVGRGQRLPKNLEGYPVQVELTDMIRPRDNA